MARRDEREQAYQGAASVLSAMSNPIRFLILVETSKRESSVGQLCDITGLAQSAVSQHLAKLRHAHLVTTRRDRQCVRYRCDSDALQRIIQQLDGFFPALASIGKASRQPGMIG